MDEFNELTLNEVNIKRFDELTPERQSRLLGYIAEYFRPQSGFVPTHTAYGLKQNFTQNNFFVTEEVFLEALIKSGYRLEEPGKLKSRVNVKVLKKLNKQK